MARRRAPGTGTPPRRTRRAAAAKGVPKKQRPRRAADREGHDPGADELDLVRALVRSKADVRNAQAAFALAAMRSRVTAHVFLRGDRIVASNELFIEMVRSSGGPWEAPGGACATLRDVVRAQSARLEDRAAVARYHRSDGTRVVEVRTERIGDASPRLVVATLLDLTSIVAAAAHAARSAAKLEALEEASRRKDEFLAMLAHELRNPLAPISSSLHTLQRSGVDAQHRRRALGILARQVRHLTRIVDELLDVSRIERGKVELHREPVDLRDVVGRAVEDLRDVVAGRGLELRTSFPDAVVTADVDATTQLLGNLLHNAAKFTPRGGEVTVSVTASAETADIGVSDSGVGIDAALLPRIFDAFTQGARTLAREKGGLGLGLAMVKRIAELHGGTAWAESAGVGKGARFTVRLPLAPAAAAPDLADHTAPRPTRSLRVLVVDDNEDSAEALAEMLRLNGHDVEVAHDGPTAITKAREHRPDAVLCDIGLPGMSGYEVAMALRADRDRGLTLLAVSGYAQPEDVRKALESGFDGHLAKPCELDEIERLLG